VKPKKTTAHGIATMPAADAFGATVRFGEGAPPLTLAEVAFGHNETVKLRFEESDEEIQVGYGRTFLIGA
jgi:hypothetical protein